MHQTDDDPHGWQRRALCRATGADMHPSNGHGVRIAKLLCAECPVRHECREYALDRREPFGVWGGLSERERRRILKQRVRQRRAA